MHGGFAFDDQPNILINTSLDIKSLDISSIKQAAFSSNSGPLSRPVSMLSFALNIYANGLDPFFFKITNLLVHLFNGGLIFVLTRSLLDTHNSRSGSRLSGVYIRFACFIVTAAWLLHPFNLTSVSYVVQRMTSLACMFTLCGLVLYVSGRNKICANQRGGFSRIVAALLIFFPLAVLSKESGFLMPLFMLVLELCFFNFETHTAAQRQIIRRLFTLTLALPAVILIGYTCVHPGLITSGYRLRDFTLTERLMTEARVLWFYIQMIILPKIGEMGLFHDDIPLSHGMLDPASTLISVVSLVALGIAAFLGRKRYPIFAFGVLFFLAGHVLESTAFALEITFEHRNYLPMYGLLFSVFYYATTPLVHKGSCRIRGVGAVAMVIIFAAQTAMRADDWSSTQKLAVSEVRNHPMSPRANAELGALFGNYALQRNGLSPDYYFSSMQYFETSAGLTTQGTDGLFGLIYYSAAMQKVLDKEWLQKLSDRLEHAPPSTSNAGKLVSLVVCQYEKTCLISSTEITSLLQAALRNPLLIGQARATIYSALASHLANANNDTAGAIAASYKAIESAPNEIEYRLTLIDIMIAINQLEAAKEQLAQAKIHDRLNLSATMILEREAKIKEKGAATSTNLNKEK